MSKTRPFIGLDYQGRNDPPMPAEACSEIGADTAPAHHWYEWIIDFLMVCILADAMAVMEEPRRAGHLSPPPIPWGQLWCGFLIAVAAVSTVYLVLGTAQ